MSKHTFNENEINELTLNTNVVKVTQKTIVFTDEFKIHLVRACDNNSDLEGFLNEQNLSLDSLGKKRMEESFYRWRSIYIKEGPAGLVGVTRGRKKSLDTDSFKKLSKDQQIQFFEKDNERLRTELTIIKTSRPYRLIEVQNQDACIELFMNYKRKTTL